jgi:hypothetical protein
VIPTNVIELLNQLPPILKGEVARQAFQGITKTIKFFEDKPSEFLWHFLPKLRQMNFFAGEFLFH